MGPSDLGENITTKGIDLLSLPKGAILKIGKEAIVEVTGLRNPCKQIERFSPGMLQCILRKHENGKTEKRAGIMGIVRKGGVIHTQDKIQVIAPTGDHTPLDVV